MGIQREAKSVKRKGNTFLRADSGFTLFELLVVIVVMSILAAFSLTTFNGAQVKARDAKRKADLRELRNVLIQYYQDRRAYPIVAAAGITSAGCPVSPPWFPLIEPSYTSKVPCDPRNAASGTLATANTYLYQYVTTCSGQGFILATRLENTSDTEIRTLAVPFNVPNCGGNWVLPGANIYAITQP